MACSPAGDGGDGGGGGGGGGGLNSLATTEHLGSDIRNFFSSSSIRIQHLYFL